ncbi:MAG TPA: hypothetical protein VFM94_03185 [Solirubrobacterales bacterium]|nr:hypothetical protein [Solirubrobacterales bacterium]
MREITPPPPGWWDRQINGVAEVQFFLRHQLRRALEGQAFADDENVRRLTGDSKHWLEFWERQSGQEFFDMATLVRLATTVEMLLRDYYRNCLGHPSISELAPKGGSGVFQRLFPWGSPSVIDLYADALAVDLGENPELRRMQELMAHRHLYAHSSGLVNENYLDNWRKLTGDDLMAAGVLGSYPDEDFFWFKPLEELDEFIEDSRRFFRWFPVSGKDSSAATSA